MEVDVLTGGRACVVGGHGRCCSCCFPLIRTERLVCLRGEVELADDQVKKRVRVCSSNGVAMKGKAGQQGKSISSLNLRLSLNNQSHVCSLSFAFVCRSIVLQQHNPKKQKLARYSMVCTKCGGLKSSVCLHWLHGYKRKGNGDQGDQGEAPTRQLCSVAPRSLP